MMGNITFWCVSTAGARLRVEEVLILILFSAGLLQGFYYLGQLPSGGMEPGFDPEIDRDDTREPETTVHVARHYITGPVRAQIDT